jgi:hypothetical protein
MPINERQGQFILDKIVQASDNPKEAMELCASMAATFIYHHIKAEHTEDFLEVYMDSIRSCITACREAHGHHDGTTLME